jgi:NitT/TauT family transport system permease protein
VSLCAGFDNRVCRHWIYAFSGEVACVAAVIGEYLGSIRGIGYVIWEAEGIFDIDAADIDAVLAGVILLTTFAYVHDVVVTLVERRLLRWQPDR